MANLDPAARLRVAALLQRILHAPGESLCREDAAALWREAAQARPRRFGDLGAGHWRLRLGRRWLHPVIEIERAAAPGRDRILIRYTLFGDPVDVLRLRGRAVAVPVWPGLRLDLELGTWRPWKRVAV